VTSDVRASYDEVASEYAKRLSSELDGKPLDRHLLNRLAEDVREGGLVADIGCGPGHVARYLSERGVRTIGIDLSPGMIERARLIHPRLEFRVGDMRSLDLPDGALAAIVAFYSLIHIEESEMPATLRELQRGLEPGGALLVAFHVGDQTLHLDELWGHAVSLDFRFLAPVRMIGLLEEAGFRVLEKTEREPYGEAIEHQSRRCYLFARKLTE
jgi:SAM-dependent methyltransferase